MNKRKIHIFFVLLFLSLWRFTALAEDDKSVVINENFKDTELKSVLSTLKKKYNLKIAFTERVVSGVLVNIELKNLSVYNSFEKILANTKLTFELIEKDVIIVKKKRINKNRKEGIIDLTGVVQDVNSGERLPYAFVLIESLNRSIPVNTDGYFSLSNTTIPVTLKISYLGYEDTEVLIDKSSVNKRLHINLTPVAKKLDEVVVSGQETNDFKLDEEAGKIIFNPEIISKMPSTGEKDIFRSLQLLPGINATNETSSGLNIQGGNSNQNLVLFDGFTVYHVDHFFGYFSAFNPNAIKSIRLFKGGFDAKYGGRVSGIIDITGKEGNLNKTSGSLGFNMLSVNTSLEVPFTDSNSSLFFSGRRSYTDIVSTSLFEQIFSNFSSIIENESPIQDGPFIRTDSDIFENDFYYSDLNLKFSTKIGPKNHLSFSFYDSNDILNYDRNTSSEVRENNFTETEQIITNELGIINWGNVGASAKWSRLWDNNHYSNVLLSYSNYESTFSEISTKDFYRSNQLDSTGVSNTRQNNQIGDFSLKIDHEWVLPNTNMLQFGVAASLYTANYNHQVNDEVFVDYNEENKGLYSFYLQYAVHEINNLALTLGIRNNFYTPTQKNYFEPRVSFIYTLNEHLFLKGAAGKYHQFINQTTSQNALEGSRDFWLLADDKKIPVQSAVHYQLGLEYKKDGYLVNVNYFKKDFDGLLEYAFRHGGLLSQFSDAKRIFDQGTGTASGLEVLVKKNTKNFDGWIAYTYSEVKHSFNLINEGRSYHADHDQRHELKLFGNYKWRKFDFHATWFLGSGKPYTKVEDVRVEDERDKIILLEFDQKNGARLKPYHRLDIGAAYNFNLGNSKAKISASFFNLYDRQNIQDINYEVIPPRGRREFKKKPLIQASEINYLGFSPNFSFKIDF